MTKNNYKCFMQKRKTCCPNLNNTGKWGGSVLFLAGTSIYQSVSENFCIDW